LLLILSGRSSGQGESEKSAAETAHVGSLEARSIHWAGLAGSTYTAKKIQQGGTRPAPLAYTSVPFPFPRPPVYERFPSYLPLTYPQNPHLVCSSVYLTALCSLVRPIVRPASAEGVLLSARLSLEYIISPPAATAPPAPQLLVSSTSRQPSTCCFNPSELCSQQHRYGPHCQSSEAGLETANRSAVQLA
jgi:hypothetical protein